MLCIDVERELVVSDENSTVLIGFSNVWRSHGSGLLFEDIRVTARDRLSIFIDYGDMVIRNVTMTKSLLWFTLFSCHDYEW